MKKSLSTLLILLSTIWLNAQTPTKQEKGYFNLTEFEYFSGKNELRAGSKSEGFVSNSVNSSAVGLRNINGFFITNKFSLGLGLALENFEGYSNYNTSQVFIDVRYYFANKASTFFILGGAGRSIPIDYDFEKGSLYNLGLGYKVKISQKTAILGSLSYVEQKIDDSWLFASNRNYGIGFKIALLL